MRAAARSFEEASAAAAGAGGGDGWLPAECQRCSAGPDCANQDEVHFATVAHPRDLLEKKGLVAVQTAPLYEHVVAAEPPPPNYEGVAAQEAVEAAQRQARAGRFACGGTSPEPPPSPSTPAGGASSGGGGGLKMLSDLMDEAARDAEAAHACAESGRSENAVDLYRQAAAKLLSLVEAHAADLGGVLRQELDVRAAKYSDNAAAILKKLDKARTLRGHALKELRDSEKSYLKGLREMESSYHAQIRADLESVVPVIKRNDENIVFGQLPALINHSLHLHQGLCNFVPENPPGGTVAVDDETFERVLGVLEEKFEGLDVYQKYVEKLGESQSIADIWNKDEESGFRSFERNQQQPLTSYLILPFQRITR
jgi:hypothetical protein